MFTDPKYTMKPMMIIPPEMMSQEDMQELRKNGICVVVAKEPALVKFVDPIPAAGSRTKIETAALSLSKKVLNKGFWTNETTRDNMCAWFVDLLVAGTALDPEPASEEKEKAIFNMAKADELRRLAREEAKAERAAAKAAKVAPKK